MGVHFETPAQHVMTSTDQALLSDATQQPATVFSGATWKTLPVTLYPAPDGMPEPADINQHAIGNCDGDSALAGIAYQNPAFLQSLITDNKDGTFAVKLFDPMAKPITVNVDSQFMVDSSGNLGQVSCKSGVACWSTVVEKAYIKYNQVFGVVSDVNGIGSEYTTPMLTGVGDSFAFNAGTLGPADITRVVEACLAAGKFITTGFNVDGVALPPGGIPAGGLTVTAHGYAGLVPASSAFMISERNPWGVVPDPNYDGSTDGVMDIPPDAMWASMMDFRIIEPGAACGPGQTAPYLPKQLDKPDYRPNITELHALKP
jgi:Calpain family cysteine protease